MMSVLFMLSGRPVSAIQQFSLFPLPYGRLEKPALDAVDLWLLPLQDLAPPLTRSLHQATNPETAAAHRLTRKMMLRLLLAAYLQVPAREVRITKAVHGKPQIDSPAGSGLYFSQSHSLDYVLVAVGAQRQLGVDIEPLSRLVRNPLALARRYFAPSEHGFLQDLGSYEQRRRAFLRLWTRKEAVVKATGGGIVSGLNRFVIDDHDHNRPRLMAMDGADCSVWSLLHLEPLPGLVGTLAAAQAVRTVRAFRVTPPSAAPVNLTDKRGDDTA